MQNNNLSSFNNMPVHKAVISNAVPAMVAMLMVLIYNLADTFFIAQTHNDCMVAAVSLAVPVFLLFMSVGGIFGVGGTSVISRAMGEGRPEYGKKVCSFCFWFCVAIGVAMTVCFLTFMDGILRVLGASEDTWEYTKQYLSIVSCGGTMSIIATSFSNILRAEGQANRAMVGQIAGNILNIILDPILILVFHMDVVGAAIATVVGNAVGTVYYIGFLLGKKTTLSISPRDFSAKDGIFAGVFSIGVPAALSQVLMSVSQIIMNSLMAGYGDMAVAAIGVAMKVTMITTMVTIGIGQGVQPLLGYCVGAKEMDRFNKLLRFGIIFALSISVFMTIVCYIFMKPIVGVFLTLPEAFDFGVHFSRVLLTTCASFGPFFVLMNALQAMGAVVPSLIVNVSRQGMICIPCLYILNSIWGVNGLVWTQPIVDIISTTMAAILCVGAIRKMRKELLKADKAVV